MVKRKVFSKIAFLLGIVFSFLFCLNTNNYVSAIDRETKEIPIKEYEVVTTKSSFYDEDIEILVFNVPTEELKKDIDYIYAVNTDYKVCNFKLFWCWNESDMKNRTFNYDVNYDMYSDSQSAGAIIFDDLKEMGKISDLISTDYWYANGSKENYMYLSGDNLSQLQKYDYYFILPASLPSEYIKVIYADYISVSGEDVRWNINTVVLDNATVDDVLDFIKGIIDWIVNNWWQVLLAVGVTILVIWLIVSYGVELVFKLLWLIIKYTIGLPFILIGQAKEEIQRKREYEEVIQRYNKNQNKKNSNYKYNINKNKSK